MTPDQLPRPLQSRMGDFHMEKVGTACPPRKCLMEILTTHVVSGASNSITAVNVIVTKPNAPYATTPSIEEGQNLRPSP